MSSSKASFSAPGTLWPPYRATKRSARPWLPFGAVLTIVALASALLVAQAMTASFSVATRHAGSLRSMEPGTHLAVPFMTDLEVADSSGRLRLDTPLSVDIDSLDGTHHVVGSDVALVSYTTAGDLPLREMSYEEFATDASRLLDLLPTLDLLQAEMPTGVFTDDIERQKAHIRALDEAAEVTRGGFESFVVDRRYRASMPADGPLEHIEPRMFIIHWTGGGYDDVDHFLRVMGSLRVQYFIDHDARVYELMSDHERPAHVLGANDFSQGVEIETGHFDEVNSPLFGYTAEQITQTVYLAVDFLHRNGLPVDRTTIVGHYAADLIFSNPYYDPHAGTFTQGRIRKFDPPEELMDVIVNKARALDRALSRELPMQVPSAALDRALDRELPMQVPSAALDRALNRELPTQAPSAALDRALSRELPTQAPSAALDRALDRERPTQAPVGSAGSGIAAH